MADCLVSDDEVVCRVGFSADFPISRDKNYPEQHDPNTGLLRLEEISIDDLNDRGFSIQRINIYNRSIADAHAADRAAKASAKLGRAVTYTVAGGHLAQVAAIHGIRGEAENQIFEVWPTPEDGQPAHAEIRAKERMTKSMLLKWRPRLQGALGPIREDFLPD